MKQLKKALSLMLIMMCISLTASAYDFEVGGIYYNIVSSESKTVSVTYATTDYNSYSGNVTIPTDVTNEGTEYIITEIGSNAFKKCSSLTSVSIPSGVTSIGSAAFSSCSSLTSVNIPNGVTSIERSAFYGCSNLTSVEIPSSVTSIDSFAFSDCTALTSVTIPNGVTKLASWAFYQCTGLTKVNIAYGVTKIDACVFDGCSGLTEVILPSTITSVTGVFDNCTNLCSVSINYKDEADFTNCVSNTSVFLNNYIKELEHHILINSSFAS